MPPSLPHPDDPSFVFDPLTPEFDRNPYPILAHLREHAPVYWWALAQGWFLTRHEDVVRILSDEENFSPDDSHWEHFTPPPEDVADHPVVRMRNSSILSMEGAQHARTRKLAFEALSRRAVRTIEPLMSSVMDEILESIRARGTCDFVAEVASPYPVGVISRLLGIPADSERERHFKQLADAVIVAFNPMTDEPTVLRAIHLMTGCLAEVREWMDEKRRDPSEDLMTHLVQAENEGDRFQPDEILSLVTALLVAGSETTANSISFGILELLRHPDQLKLFKEDRNVRANAAYEIVRFEMPGRFLRRYAKKPVSLRGFDMQAGQAVYLSVASAQRDPSFLPDADRFDITRSPRDLSAFGVGRHFCIGAQLARLELEVGLSRIFDTLPNIQLDCRFDEIPFRSNPAIRGPAALPIRFDPTP
ncbi:MAG: cytochrome P450 [Myxococcota bacterium]|nr:cytochrome P450 [Myxococcota bacterium]